MTAAAHGTAPDEAAALALEAAPAAALVPAAQALTRAGFGRTVTYSRKVFIPLTQLCRDVCHYCTFAQAPRRLASPYLAPEAVLEIARAGVRAGCREALFTLGDKPELRYAAARRALATLGFATTLDYLRHCADLVLRETGLLPHLNPGVMTAADLQALRPVSVSMGLMLESASERLTLRGGAHFGSPDKAPALRLRTLDEAGALRIPFTTGLLIGIGETRRERLESLFALRRLHARHGHLQELILQNFRAKPGTRMAGAAEPSLEEQLWTVAVARLIFGAGMSLQAPPNLRPADLAALVGAGVNDWGGVSPVTPDHVNPEAPWPHLAALARDTAAAGRELAERLALTPAYAREPQRWVDAALVPKVLRLTDADGCAHPADWYAGAGTAAPLPEAQAVRTASGVRPRRGDPLHALLRRARTGGGLTEPEVAALFSARGPDFQAVVHAADRLRADVAGEEVTYVVNRNINYTNICLYHCGFCAFSKGRSARSLRGPAYRLDLDEIARRTREAAAAGATEVCLQGGIHPDYTGNTYLEIVAAVKGACPDMHVHAFSPLEITHGARTLGLSLASFLSDLRAAGLSTLPGTAAEILDDEVRQVICPDKLTTAEWLEVMRAAHAQGLKSTATIMFGHVDSPTHWARHLLAVRDLQRETGGFTEFVPLPFVHMEAPLWRQGRARSGPTLREALLMHAVARLALHPHIPNIQTSWVKMGADGAALALDCGANDLGGTLMNESITRAAGGVNGQEFDAARIQALAAERGRPARQRTTLYRRIAGAPGGRRRAALAPAG
ncbi:MAG: 5-amino-6-(D-ribitylamino)uracil--L-tyrosine 4-hydroxyphenyl transferase CofH [Proteobacteria bacterium]|nr:5-amino-6-(D-ribitylamino)uracil--L-tyrosine 4-hydroxyphenyl transferase CofH [Pseudomonadota bacterium]